SWRGQTSLYLGAQGRANEELYQPYLHGLCLLGGIANLYNLTSSYGIRNIYMSDASQKSAADRFGELVNLIARLRAPGGCPWDREQTHESLKPMLLEEAYEVIEAIDDGDDEELIGELGDLLLQVVFHSDIATEQGRFTIGEVIERIANK